MISPTTYLALCVDSDNEIERRIDAALRDHATDQPSSAFAFRTNLIGDLAAIMRTLDKYRDAGWVVTVTPIDDDTAIVMMSPP